MFAVFFLVLSLLGQFELLDVFTVPGMLPCLECLWCLLDFNCLQWLSVCSACSTLDVVMFGVFVVLTGHRVFSVIVVFAVTGML